MSQNGGYDNKTGTVVQAGPACSGAIVAKISKLVPKYRVRNSCIGSLDMCDIEE